MVKKVESRLEKLMESQFRGLEFPPWEREFRFFNLRKWRFDFAFPTQKIALEVEGGSWSQSSGAHTRGKGFEEDIEKYNSAVLLGWKVLRATSKHVESGLAAIWVKTLLSI